MSSRKKRAPEGAGSAPGAPPPLRERAEATMREGAAAGAEHVELLSPEAVRRTLHELRVHQIELEMQNEELQRAQVELDAARAHYFELYDLAPVGYCSVGGSGLILEANLATGALLQVARSALIGKSMSGFVHADDQDAYHLLRRRLMEGESPQASDMRMVRHDGTPFWAHMAINAAQDGAGAQVMRVVLNDISERKRAEADRAMLEAQLLESQKMEVLGTLAAGVAHDFNNVLAMIMGNVELARQDVGPDHPAMESLDAIDVAGRRAKDRVQQILMFGRRHTLDLKSILLAPVVMESARLIRTTLPARVNLSVRCDADTPPVKADATEITQLLLNLCNNAVAAIQAERRSGVIEILLEPSGVGAARADLRQSSHACLTVRDDGPGMDEMTRRRIFEPFFSTKPAGEGTGLGLSVVEGIVHDHGASIEVESAPGKGSTFRIYFPAVATDVQVERPLPARTPPVHGHAKHILYVDDEHGIVSLMRRLLVRRGFRFTGYTDPREALAAVRSAPAQFDLVVTDFNMPYLSGLQVAEALKSIRADLPVVLASGYISEELRAQAPAAGIRELIYKASRVDDLCEAVARCVLAQA